MKILHVCAYYHPHIGGIEQVARDAVNCLTGEAEQRVVCFNHEKGNKTNIVDGVEVTRAGCFLKVASQSLSASFGKLLKRQFKEFNPDAVIFHYPNPFMAHSLLKCIKKYPGCKLVLWWHLDITKQKILGKLFNGQNHRLLKRANFVVATSPNYIENSKYLPVYSQKCRVIPCCVSSEMVKTDEEVKALAEKIKSENEGKTVCFALGRHVEYKGIEYLVRASKLLDDSFKIYIGGSGPLTDGLKELAKGDDKITFIGRAPTNEIKAYLSAADIFCFPSITKNEAFGIALAEAMYYGKPSVTFTIEGSGVNYVSLNGVTGIEVENRNVEKYAEGIKTLAADKSLREKYGAAAKDRVKNLFTNEKFIENVKNLLKDLK